MIRTLPQAHFPAKNRFCELKFLEGPPIYEKAPCGASQFKDMSTLSSISNSASATYATQLAQTSALKRSLNSLGIAVQNGDLTSAGSILAAFIKANPQFASTASEGPKPRTRSTRTSKRWLMRFPATKLTRPKAHGRRSRATSPRAESPTSAMGQRRRLSFWHKLRLPSHSKSSATSSARAQAAMDRSVHCWVEAEIGRASCS